MVCPQCNQEFKSGKFCPSCGCAVESAQTQQASIENQQQFIPPQPSAGSSSTQPNMNFNNPQPSVGFQSQQQFVVPTVISNLGNEMHNKKVRSAFAFFIVLGVIFAIRMFTTFGAMANVVEIQALLALDKIKIEFVSALTMFVPLSYMELIFTALVCASCVFMVILAAKLKQVSLPSDKTSIVNSYKLYSKLSMITMIISLVYLVIEVIIVIVAFQASELFEMTTVVSSIIFTVLMVIYSIQAFLESKKFIKNLQVVEPIIQAN